MTRMKLPLMILGVSLAVAVGVGFVSGSAVKKTTVSATKKTTAVAASRKAASPTPLATGVALQQAFVNVYKKVSPSVVQIQTSTGLGSGIVFDNKGDIVTNDHVVGSATTFTVTTASGTGKQLKGTLVGTFKEDDLAVIKVNGTGLKPAIFADSTKVRVGDIAMAIGNPLGLSSSVTEGIVSALNRQEPEGNGVVLPNAIQTSAPINPGNSGGALVDIRGRVIGIPTLAAADPQLGGAAAGIGFAIPSNVVKSIAGQLIKYGKVVNSGRAYLGVKIADTGQANGVYITEVLPGTAAAKAGLKVGQLIVAVDGTPTPTSTELGTILAGLKPGKTVTIKLRSQTGATSTAKLTLGQYPGGIG